MRVDPVSALAVSLPDSGIAWSSRAIAVDPSTGQVYAITGRDLYTVDPATGTLSFVVTLSGPTLDTVQGLAIDASGVGWAVDLGAEGLFTFDLSTGVATHLGNLNIPDFLFTFRDLAFDAAGQLWSVGNPANFAANDGLYRIDTVDLSTSLELVGSFAGVSFRSDCGGTTYCVAKLNSAGCLPAIAGTGGASASSAQPFVISAANVLNQKPGLLIYGMGRATIPFQGGTLCIQPPLARTPLLFSGGSVGQPDCSGTLAFDFNAEIAAGGLALLSPGQEIAAQFLTRDPQGSFGVGLTDAIEFPVCP